MPFDEREYLRSVIKAHSQTTVGGNCAWCSVPAPCQVLTEATEFFEHEARLKYERNLLIEFLQRYDPDAADSGRDSEAVDDFLSERYNE